MQSCYGFGGPPTLALHFGGDGTSSCNTCPGLFGSGGRERDSGRFKSEQLEQQRKFLHGKDGEAEKPHLMCSAEIGWGLASGCCRRYGICHVPSLELLAELPEKTEVLVMVSDWDAIASPVTACLES